MAFNLKKVMFTSGLLSLSSYLAALEYKQMDVVSRSIDAVPISLQGRKLNGFHYKVVYTVSLIGCGQACLTDFPKCISYNFLTKFPGQEVCELNSRGINSVMDGIASSLQKDPSSVFVQTHSPLMKYPTSCAGHYKRGTRENGLYYIRDDNHQFFQVFCDFTSEANKVWTLVTSASFKHRTTPQFQTKAFYLNYPLKENSPNWDYYRLSLPRMQLISRSSTHWRITCNFPQDGLSYVDYVRGKISEVNMLKFQGGGQCKHVEYVNVLKHKCSDCTLAWWQIDGSYIFHHDITYHSCDFGATPGGINSQDVFGYYWSVNNNFRCCLSDTSNTNYWFGSEV